jgi:hypothetical protein
MVKKTTFEEKRQKILEIYMEQVRHSKYSLILPIIESSVQPEGD